jgi:predicted DNA-binding transcriptional regulator YafY
MKLLNSLKHIILEEVSQSDIQDSIKNKKVITIYYKGKDNGGEGYRTIEPVCYGLSKKGNRVLRAWEREGASWSEKNKGNLLPGWRLFRVDKILSLKPTGDIYNEPRPGYNFNGDKTMASVILNAKFNNPPQENVA